MKGRRLGGREGQQSGPDQESTAGRDLGRQIGHNSGIKRLSEERGNRGTAAQAGPLLRS